MYISSIVLAAILSLSQTNPSVKVELVEAPVSLDVAMTERFIGANYGDTTACKITIDPTRFAHATEQAKKNHIPISRERLRDFIILHELAHCFDGVQEPPGVDSMEWREFLADVYAGEEMVATQTITVAEYRALIKFRKTLPDAYKRIALQEALPLITEGALADTAAGRISAAKDFRSIIFAAE